VTTPEELCGLLPRLAALPPMGEPVDQLAHALQTAGQAIDAGADDDLVLAAALHDLARLPELAARHPGLPHEEAAARLCAPLLGERVAWLVGAHVLAKRVLVATEPAHAAVLSATSTRSLRAQGGAAAAAELRRFGEHPWSEDALRLRRWDDAAKVPGAAAPEPGDLLDRMRRRWR
jgi:predicted HD phosphohydrolase